MNGAARRILGSIAVVLLGGLVFVYSGLFDPAADVPHSRVVYWILETLRDRGVETRVRSIDVPDLRDVALVRSGAGNYEAMCATCHLKPGVSESEMQRGLYPQPPAFAGSPGAVPPEKAFWTIKHGIKSSGMPAWGKSMKDDAIWGMVAFLQRLPELTPSAYEELVESSEGHSHAHAPESDVDEHSHAANESGEAVTGGAHEHTDDHTHEHSGE